MYIELYRVQIGSTLPNHESWHLRVSGQPASKPTMSTGHLNVEKSCPSWGTPARNNVNLWCLWFTWKIVKQCRVHGTCGVWL